MQLQLSMDVKWNSIQVIQTIGFAQSHNKHSDQLELTNIRDISTKAIQLCPISVLIALRRWLEDTNAIDSFDGIQKLFLVLPRFSRSATNSANPLISYISTLRIPVYSD